MPEAQDRGGWYKLREAYAQQWMTMMKVDI